jgi:hypothetical protein
MREGVKGMATPIIDNDLDKQVLDYLVRNGKASRAAIDSAAEKIAAKGSRPYVSNICKFYGLKCGDIIKAIKAEQATAEIAQEEPKEA